MRFVSLASGSSGNSTFISNENVKILIDCGISFKLLNERLEDIDENIDDIDYIFLTHSHDDHIKSVYKMAKDTKAKIYAKEQIINEVIDINNKNNKELDCDKLFPISNNINTINIDKNFKIKIYKAYHDVYCVYYKICIDNYCIAILTDNGHYDEKILKSINDVNFLMLECNYDYDMLMDYEYYPDYLKQRISGSNGHLSNIDCCKVIEELSNQKLNTVCLSHISEHSNTEEYALQFVNEYFDNNKNIKKPNIICASRHKVTQII